MKKKIIRLVVSLLMVGFLATSFSCPVKADSFEKHFSKIINSGDYERIYYYSRGTGLAKNLSKTDFFQRLYTLYLLQPQVLRVADRNLYDYVAGVQKKNPGLFPNQKTINSLRNGTLAQDIAKENALKEKALKQMQDAQKAKAAAEAKQWQDTLKQLEEAQKQQEKLLEEQYRQIQEMMAKGVMW